jgi:hypothetical protein
MLLSFFWLFFQETRSILFRKSLRFHRFYAGFTLFRYVKVTLKATLFLFLIGDQDFEGK